MRTHLLPRHSYSTVLAALVLSLTACGGGGSDSENLTPPPAPAPAPSPAPSPAPPQPTPQPENNPELGRLLSAEPLQNFSSSAIAQALAADHSKVPEITPYYGVATYRITYRTEDAQGALTTASGLIALPLKPQSDTRPSPVISYQHATTFSNDNAPSRKLEAGEPPMALASQGYIVVAADYVGFGASTDRPHPYLQARPTARAVIDMLSAAQTWRTQNAVADNRQLYLVGYSEGGYATMAAQREMQRSQHPLLGQLQASLPASGPYDLQTTLDKLLLRVRDEYPAIAWLLKPGTLKHLGSTVRAEVRRALVRELIPDDADVSYDARFIDVYLADDTDTLKQNHSVHWGWTPTAPVYLFHGRDDQTVPYAVSETTITGLQATGAAAVSLRDCRQSSPAGHLQCVPEYFSYALQVMGQTAQNLHP